MQSEEIAWRVGSGGVFMLLLLAVVLLEAIYLFAPSRSAALRVFACFLIFLAICAGALVATIALN